MYECKVNSTHVFWNTCISSDFEGKFSLWRHTSESIWHEKLRIPCRECQIQVPVIQNGDEIFENFFLISVCELKMLKNQKSEIVSLAF